MADSTLAPSGLPRRTWLVSLWLVLTALFPFALGLLARRAHRRQGAAPARFAERLGQPAIARPEGRLIWLHAASVGEVTSALRLAQRIAALDGVNLLVTTSTTTGAMRVADRLPMALHQFLPLDTPAAVTGFLDHWSPDAALFVEGDLWPRMILALAGRKTPMALINARASRSRQRFPGSFASLLAPMALITVQEDSVLQGMLALGLNAGVIRSPGNLKADITAPEVNKVLKAHILASGKGRGIWAAVSTHAGEEAIVLDAQTCLDGDPLLVLVPRHPDRAMAILAELASRKLRVARHAHGEWPDKETQVYLVDVLGETGAAYAAAGVVLVGGSLVAGPGGHTPYEPAALHCAILTGPQHANFTSAFKGFVETDGAQVVSDAKALAAALTALWRDPAALAAMQAAAFAEQQRQSGATDRTFALLAPVLGVAASEG